MMGGAAKAKVGSRGAPPGSTLWTCYPLRAEQPLPDAPKITCWVAIGCVTVAS